MDWLEKAIKTVKGALGFKDTSKPTQQCPLKKTGLIVVVLREDTRRPIEGARVNLTGPANQSKPTDKDGLAQFRMLVPANYTIRVALPDRIKDDFEQPEPGMEYVGEETCPIHIIHVKPLAELKVKVIARGKDRNGRDQEIVLEGVQVQISGTATKSESTPKDALGWASFKRVKAGQYRAKTQSLGQHAQKYKDPVEVETSVSPGATKEVVLVVKPRASLRVVLYDKEQKAISGKDWELTSPVSARGKTSGDGLIEIKDLDLERSQGLLKVKMGAPEAPPKTSTTPDSTPPADPPPHPPKIEAKQFTEKAPEPEEPPAPDGLVEWTLSLGLPEDYQDDAGSKSRLANLAFNCNSTSDGTTTSNAVKCYQRHHQKAEKPSGVLAEIKGHITNLHDNP